MNSSFKALPDGTASHALSNTAVTMVCKNRNITIIQTFYAIDKGVR